MMSISWRSLKSNQKVTGYCHFPYDSNSLGSRYGALWFSWGLFSAMKKNTIISLDPKVFLLIFFKEYWTMILIISLHRFLYAIFEFRGYTCLGICYLLLFHNSWEHRLPKTLPNEGPEHQSTPCHVRDTMDTQPTKSLTGTHRGSKRSSSLWKGSYLDTVHVCCFW